MRKKWRFGSGSKIYEIVRRADVYPPEALACAEPDVSEELAEWLKDKKQRPSLIEIDRSLHGRGAPATDDGEEKSDDELEARLNGALRRRTLIAVRTAPNFLTQAPQEDAAGAAAAAPGAPPPDSKKKTTWIKFRVVEDHTDRPINDVQLKITLPGGEETIEETSNAGTVEIDDIKPGSCRVTSVIDGARMATTLAFVKIGASPSSGAKGGAATTSPTSAPLKTDAVTIAEVKTHQVKTGDTLASVARSYKISEQDLTQFNFGTDDPAEINERLRDRVGSTKKTADGRNYVLDGADKPGLLYVPQPWEQKGLATEQTHVVRVKTLNNFYVILENERELRIPEAAYEATLADKSVRRGTLGRGGVDLIEDPPPGPIKVVFTDHEDVGAKSLAACARRAFEERDAQEIFRVLNQPPETVKKAVAAYDKYFNDLTGKGLVEDVYQEITDESALVAVEGALAWAKLPTRRKVEFVKDEN